MRPLLILIAACALWACSGDDKPRKDTQDAGEMPGPADAGMPEPDAQVDPEEDAGTDAGVPSALPRPPTDSRLPAELRPPTDGRLPADLRPPAL